MNKLQNTKVKKKVTFSDYDEIEIIDEWAVVYQPGKF